MLNVKICILAVTVSITIAIQYPTNPTSEMSTDDKNIPKNRTLDGSEIDESGHEIENDMEDIKDRKFLEDAMKTVLDPNSIILKNDDVVENFKMRLEQEEKQNKTLYEFMQDMDNLSLEVCKTSQEALWSYVTDINNESKKNKMVHIAAEEDEIKKQYWNILKTKYFDDFQQLNDSKLQKKIRIIKERGTNVQMPQSKQREEIDTMQKIWSRVTVCSYNSSTCNEGSIKTMNDIITIFKTSNDTEELRYYWKVYRDNTGKKIRPIFKDYVMRMNNVAETENFTDAGAMWRYAFEDDDFLHTVDRIWSEIKPFYDLLREYVRAKLKVYYKKELQKNVKTIPAHLLGNLWAQEWQSIYPKVAAYPTFTRPQLINNETMRSKDLFDTVDDFHQSIGFETAGDSYQDIQETMTTSNCLPSSHDMCDGVHYKIKWCGEKITDIAIGMSRAARLLGHVQYFKHYQHLPPLYRDGPNPVLPVDYLEEIIQSVLLWHTIEQTKILVSELKEAAKGGATVSAAAVAVAAAVKQMVDNIRSGPQLTPLIAYAVYHLFLPPPPRQWPRAFHDAISDVIAMQLITPEHLKTLSYVKVETGPEATMNHLLWVALEKFPLMAYAYALDKWRWDIFANRSLEDWNQHWWDLRTKETGVSPPTARNESDLDPAAKYHVVSHVQYITYLVSHVLEFQIMSSLCKTANHTGPLHECSIKGIKEAGKLLSDGMSLGASEDWRVVLKAMTGETEISTKGILEYFSYLRDFLKEENVKLAKLELGDMDQSAPIIVGVIVVLLTITIVILYCVKKHNVGSKVLTVCGLSKNGSLDIAACDVPRGKTNEIDIIQEDKV